MAGQLFGVILLVQTLLVLLSEILFAMAS